MPGERAVLELLRAAPTRARQVWIDDRRDFPEIRALAKQEGVALEAITAERLEARAPGVATRGALALAEPPAQRAIDELAGAAGLVVALDGVLDPQNLGAIMRCADFFGAAGLLWTKDRAAPLSPAVVRASAGASERLPLCQVTNLDDALRRLKAADVWVLGTVAEGGEPLRELVLADRIPTPLCVVFGSEQRGLRRLTRERCDLLGRIDGASGHVGSLNVASACSATLALLTLRA